MVLAYHEITARPSSYLYSVTCDAFVSHLDTVKSLPATAAAQPPFCITFDDGHRSHHENALPLLDQSGIKGLFFVTAGWTDAQPDYMSSGQLRELSKLGHQVQAHGWSHKMLTLCSPAELFDELRHAKTSLEDRLGLPVRAISMPHGRWNDRVLRACQEAGYRDVYTSQPSVSILERSGIRLIGRTMVTRKMTAPGISQLLQGKVNRLSVALAKDILKDGARRVIGEKRYHALWRSIAVQTRPPLQIAKVSRPKRVLHLISSGGYYGAEAMIVNLGTSLRALDCESTVAVFCNARNPHIEVAENAAKSGLNTEIIPCRKRIDRVALATVRSLIDRHGIDLVHTHGFKSDVYGSFAARPLGVPLIATHHSNWPTQGALLHGYHLLDRVTLRKFNKVVAVSDEIASSLRRSGVPESRLKKIYNGQDVGPFEKAAATAQATTREWGGPAIGLVGRLIPGKGHGILLQAAPDLLKHHPDLVFVFVGNGPEREALARTVAELGLQNKVIFAGQRTDMPQVFASLDIVVLPSDTEGLPMTLIEALAAQRPVVASDVGGIPSLIRHRETGLLIKPRQPRELGSAIRELLADPALCATLSRQGQLAARFFSAEIMAQRYADVYKQVIEEYRQHPGPTKPTVRQAHATDA